MKTEIESYLTNIEMGQSVESELSKLSDDNLEALHVDVINEMEGISEDTNKYVCLGDLYSEVTNEITRRKNEGTWQQEENSLVSTHNLASDILDLFEEVLEEKDIIIPDEDRTGEEGEARIYGMTYSTLMGKVEDNLISLLDRCGVKYVSDRYI